MRTAFCRGALVSESLAMLGLGLMEPTSPKLPVPSHRPRSERPPIRWRFCRCTFPGHTNLGLSEHREDQRQYAFSELGIPTWPKVLNIANLWCCPSDSMSMGAYSGQSNFGFADGHVKSMKRDQLIRTALGTPIRRRLKRQQAQPHSLRREVQVDERNRKESWTDHSHRRKNGAFAVIGGMRLFRGGQARSY